MRAPVALSPEVDNKPPAAPIMAGKIGRPSERRLCHGSVTP
jgi:hypothetical protein